MIVVVFIPTWRDTVLFMYTYTRTGISIALVNKDLSFMLITQQTYESTIFFSVIVMDQSL